VKPHGQAVAWEARESGPHQSACRRAAGGRLSGVIVYHLTPYPAARRLRRRSARAPLLEGGQRVRRDDPARPTTPHGAGVGGAQLAARDPTPHLVLADTVAPRDVVDR